MIRLSILALLLATTTIAWADDAAPPAASKESLALDLSTTRLKASYAIGVRIGKSIKEDGLDIDVASLAAGMRASMAGSKMQLTDAEMGMAIQAFHQEAQARLAERRRIEGEQNKKQGEAFLKKNGQKEGVVTLKSGLQYEVIKKGGGDRRPAKTDRVTTHYHGTLIDGTVFDSSVEREAPATFPVGGVIAGWTEALQLMNVGDKWRLFVPAELAYGARGAGADIGPHATLIFEVELLGIE